MFYIQTWSYSPTLWIVWPDYACQMKYNKFMNSLTKDRSGRHPHLEQLSRLLVQAVSWQQEPWAPNEWYRDLASRQKWSMESRVAYFNLLHLEMVGKLPIQHKAQQRTCTCLLSSRQIRTRQAAEGHGQTQRPPRARYAAQSRDLLLLRKHQHSSRHKAWIWRRCMDGWRRSWPLGGACGRRSSGRGRGRGWRGRRRRLAVAGRRSVWPPSLQLLG